MFPLSSFLHTLESDGICLTVRDHDRIMRTLGCDGGWTVARLRDVLLALLAKDENQRELLGHRFDIFFAAGLRKPETAAVDMAGIRAELQNFQPGRYIPPKKSDRPAAKRPQPPVTIKRDPRRWQRLALLLTLVGLAGGLITAWLLFPAAPLLHVTPPAHVMTTTPEAPETAQFTLRNNGGGRLVIRGIKLSIEDGAFRIENNTCKEVALMKDIQCLVQVVFSPKAEGSHQVQLHITSDTGGFTADLTGHGKQIVEPLPYDPGDIDNLPPFLVMPHIAVIQKRQETTVADKDTWRQAAALAGFFFILSFIFGWYLIKARRPPEDKPPVWDETKPRHFPLEKVGGAPAPRLDDETLAHLADSMGYFQSERAGRRPDIDASVLATVEQGGMPRLVFQRGKELRHLIILEDGLAGEALALNPIAGELRAGMIRHGVSLISGRFYGDPAVFHSESGQTVYLDDLEAARRSFLLLIFSAGSGIHDMGHTLENLTGWPQVAWFDLRAPEFLDPAAALPAGYGIPMYSGTAAGLLQAFARFLSEVAPQRDAAENARDWNGPPPQGETPLAAYLETLLGDALPWAQACAMVQPTGSGLADGLRREFYAHLPPERIERLAALPGTTCNAAGFCFSTAVLAELRHGFTCRHPSAEPPAAPGSLQKETTTGLPSQEAVLRFILAELEKSWVRALREYPALQGSPAQLAWERHYQRVQLELDPDAALQRLAELAASPLGNAVKADLVNVVLPEDEARGKQPAGIPLRKSPTANDSRQRLARLAGKSGIPTLRAYPLKWWQWGLAALLVLGLLGTAGWSGWAFLQAGALRPRIEVAGGPDMRVKAAVERWENGNWQQVYEKTSMPFQVEVKMGGLYRLALYGTDEKTPLHTMDLGDVEENLAVQLATEPQEKSQNFGELVATNPQRQVLKNGLVTVRNALFSQTAAADKTLHLAPGQWLIKVEMGAVAPAEADKPVSAGGSDWQAVTIAAGIKIYVEFTTDVYFRDRLKNGGYGPQMVSIPAGSFTMGSPGDEEGRNSVEGPQHTVFLDTFAIGRYEVTFAEYDAFCEATGREKPDDEGWGRGSRPVIDVSWEDAKDYAAWLSGLTGTEYRLPTEAEWEYSARARTESSRYWGDDADEACGYGNVDDLAFRQSEAINKLKKEGVDLDLEPHQCHDGFGQTAPAGFFVPNDFGLYDMAGNVLEWVNDWYAEDYYTNSPEVNPLGPEKGVARVLRGGSWSGGPIGVRSAIRVKKNPAIRANGVGFRLARIGWSVSRLVGDDRIPLVIKLFGLAAEQTVYDETLYMGGQVTADEVLTHFTINGETGWRRATKQIIFGRWVSLKPGNNRFVLEARDQSGHVSRQEVLVKYVVPSVKRLTDRLRVAVYPFEEKGEISWMGETVYDSLHHALVNQGRFQIMERSHLEEILRKLKLSQTELDDPATLVRLGKIPTADMMMFGTVNETRVGIEVWARLVDVNTSEILASEDVSGEDLTIRDLKNLMEGLAWKLAKQFPIVEGRVIDVEGNLVSVDSGSEVGIIEGMKLIIFREGEALKDPRTGKIRKKPAKKLGEAKVEAVYEGYAEARLSEGNIDNVTTADKFITK